MMVACSVKDNRQWTTDRESSKIGRKHWASVILDYGKGKFAVQASLSLGNPVVQWCI